MENLNLKVLNYKGNTLEFYENYILFNDKPCRVIKSKTYSYKINKKSISAIRGSYGLYSLINDCIEHNFALCWVEAIVNGMERITA